jgi:NDP-sugar pyrophosphorylase family protein
MAGRGSRLIGHQGDIPKPFLMVGGRPMLAWAMKSLENVAYSQIVIIMLREHAEKYGVENHLEQLSDERQKLILLDHVTEGQLCTVLAARDLINTDEDVLVSSSDTYVVSNLAQDIISRHKECHGIISVANQPGDRWSFVRTDDTGRVIEVAEKHRISNHASTGMYYFSNGRELVNTAEEMIEKQEKTRGEYYVIPVYQKYIERRWQVATSVAQEMWDMGTPDALTMFEKHLRE